MTKKLTIFLALVFGLGIILAFGCEGGGGAAKEEEPPPPPPPPTAMDMVVWGQKVPTEVGAPPAAEIEEISEEKAKSLKKLGMPPGPPVAEPTDKAQVVAFYVSNADGTGTARLTPKGTSAVSLAEKPAPNGDFWFWAKPGIFITNVTDPKPRMLISNEELFKLFPDYTKGLYWFEDLLEAEKDRKHSLIQIDTFFVPLGDDANNYVALLLLNPSVIKADTGKEAKPALWLRYDSKTGTYEFIIPAFSTTDYPIKFGEGWEVSLEYPTSLKYPTGIGPNYTFDFTTPRILYALHLLNKSGNEELSFIVEYDPLTNKHHAVDKSKCEIIGENTTCEWSNAWLPTKENIAEIDYYPGEGCILYQRGAEVSFEGDKCTEKYTPAAVMDYTTGKTNDPEKIKAQKKVLACMQASIDQTTVSLICSHRVDITPYLSSAEKFSDLLKVDSEGAAKDIAGIGAGLISQKIYKEATVADDVQCDPKADEPSCRPIKNKDVIPLPKSQSGYESYKLYEFYGDYSYLTFLGKIREGDEAWDALYNINLSNGNVALMDKEDTTSALLEYAALTETYAGPLFIYRKFTKSEKGTPTVFRAFFAYDPASGALNQLTKYTPYSVSLESFDCNIDGGGASCNGTTFDRLWLFSQVTDDIGRTNVYKKDLSGIFPPPVSEEQPGEPEEAEATDVGADQGSAALTPKASEGGEGEVAKGEEISPFGELAYPEVKHKGIHADIKGIVGDRAILTSNEEGYDYLYWNMPFSSDITLHKISASDAQSDETLVTIAKFKEYIPPVEYDIVDINADISQKFACGSGGPHATYCPNPREMCDDGKCVDMYLCSNNARNGVCVKEDEICDNGQCVTKCKLDSDCWAVKGDNKYICSEYKCKAVECTNNAHCKTDQECNENHVCVTKGEQPKPACASDDDCATGYQCINGSCIISECPNGHSDCSKFQACSNGDCIYTQDQECQVVAQCGPGFSCDSFKEGQLKLCMPIVYNLELSVLDYEPSGTCPVGYCPPPASICSKYKYDLKATWTAKDNVDHPNYKGFYGGLYKGDSEKGLFSNVECGPDDSCEVTFNDIPVYFCGSTSCGGIPFKCTTTWSSVTYDVKVIPNITPVGGKEYTKSITLKP